MIKIILFVVSIFLQIISSIGITFGNDFGIANDGMYSLILMIALNTYYAGYTVEYIANGNKKIFYSCYLKPFVLSFAVLIFRYL